MMTYEWRLWGAFVFVFLVVPVVYGAGYRNWGLPYPTFVQRRREQNAIYGRDGTLASGHVAWGVAGDAVWAALFIGVAWAVAVALIR